ncbi:MAG TPA: polysaccharide deacetylase family protein [Rhodanobacteraceae bacterium]|nr:polysaccharide deacetylase family protein [Rhodanobacteraceae bacterium]
MSWRPKKQTLLALLPPALVRVRGAAHAGTRYLSFDDGPHPQHTPDLLDLLAQHDIKATFFLVGSEAERYPALVERMVADGHRIGNHSHTHPQFGALDIAAQLDEIDRCDRVLTRFDGRVRHPFRPPRGELSLALLWQCARRRQGIVYWSRDSLDYRSGEAPAALAERLRTAPLAAGDILLMHDDAACAAAILRALLPEWLAAGFRFDRLPALDERA